MIQELRDMTYGTLLARIHLAEGQILLAKTSLPACRAVFQQPQEGKTGQEVVHVTQEDRPFGEHGVHLTISPLHSV